MADFRTGLDSFSDFIGGGDDYSGFSGGSSSDWSSYLPSVEGWSSPDHYSSGLFDSDSMYGLDRFTEYGMPLMDESSPVESRGMWDTFNQDYLQPVGDFMGTPGGRFGGALVMGGLGGLDAYLANGRNSKAQKKMLAQRQAVLDQMNARNAKYDAPIMGAVNTREEAEGPWGVGQDRYKNNSLAAITPGSSPSYLAGFAEGGAVYREPKIIGYDENRVPIYATEEEPAPEPKKAAPPKPKSQSPLERLGAMFGVTSAIKKGQRDREFASGGYADGGTPGQSDKIPAMLSDGEFVIDADTVAALGDGNNAAGASALERMRQNVRKHKRSAPANKIPPKAKKPEQYMKKGK